MGHKSELVWDLCTVQPPSRFHCRKNSKQPNHTKSNRASHQDITTHNHKTLRCQPTTPCSNWSGEHKNGGEIFFWPAPLSFDWSPQWKRRWEGSRMRRDVERASLRHQNARRIRSVMLFQSSQRWEFISAWGWCSLLPQCASVLGAADATLFGTKAKGGLRGLETVGIL